MKKKQMKNKVLIDVSWTYFQTSLALYYYIF